MGALLSIILFYVSVPGLWENRWRNSVSLSQSDCLVPGLTYILKTSTGPIGVELRCVGMAEDEVDLVTDGWMYLAFGFAIG
jgi:hypothetical protein